MRYRFRPRSLIVGAILGVVVAGPGCGGDDATGAASDAGMSTDSPPSADSPPSVDSTTDIPSSDLLVVAPDANDSSPPTDAGGAFCQAEQQFYQRCNFNSQCQQQNVAGCRAQEAFFSAGAVQAAMACFATDSCDLDGGRRENTACFEQHLA